MQNWLEQYDNDTTKLTSCYTLDRTSQTKMSTTPAFGFCHPQKPWIFLRRVRYPYLSSVIIVYFRHWLIWKKYKNNKYEHYSVEFLPTFKGMVVSHYKIPNNFVTYIYVRWLRIINPGQSLMLDPNRRYTPNPSKNTPDIRWKFVV